MKYQDFNATYLMLAHQTPIELRIITKDQRIIIETVSTEDEFIKVCQRWDGKAQIDYGLNERREGFRDGKTEHQTATAEDIAAITRIVIDIDPIRAEGFEGQPSTDEELNHAFKASEYLAQWHEERGFLRPARVMSGNGYQLWFACPQWDVTDANREQVKASLKAFEQEFRDALPELFRDKVTIDGTHDLTRMLQVIGTINVKCC